MRNEMNERERSQVILNISLEVIFCTVFASMAINQKGHSSTT